MRLDEVSELETSPAAGKSRPSRPLGSLHDVAGFEVARGRRWCRRRVAQVRNDAMTVIAPELGGPHVFISRSCDVLQSATAQELQLSPEWQDRWARFRVPQDADDFRAARVAARRLVATLLPGKTFTLDQYCSTCGRRGHGQPEVVGADAGDIVVSWAHSKGVVAVAAGTGLRRLGIDLEFAAPEEAVAPEIAVSGRHFVRAEALVKAGVFDLDAALRQNLDWPWSPQTVATLQASPSRAGRGLRMVDFDASHLTGPGPEPSFTAETGPPWLIGVLAWSSA